MEPEDQSEPIKKNYYRKQEVTFKTIQVCISVKRQRAGEAQNRILGEQVTILENKIIVCDPK